MSQPVKSKSWYRDREIHKDYQHEIFKKLFSNGHFTPWARAWLKILSVRFEHLSFKTKLRKMLPFARGSLVVRTWGLACLGLRCSTVADEKESQVLFWWREELSTWPGRLGRHGLLHRMFLFVSSKYHSSPHLKALNCPPPKAAPLFALTLLIFSWPRCLRLFFGFENLPRRVRNLVDTAHKPGCNASHLLGCSSSNDNHSILFSFETIPLGPAQIRRAPRIHKCEQIWYDAASSWIINIYSFANFGWNKETHRLMSRSCGRTSASHKSQDETSRVLTVWVVDLLWRTTWCSYNQRVSRFPNFCRQFVLSICFQLQTIGASPRLSSWSLESLSCGKEDCRQEACFATWTNPTKSAPRSS